MTGGGRYTRHVAGNAANLYKAGLGPALKTLYGPDMQCRASAVKRKPLVPAHCTDGAMDAPCLADQAENR